MKSEVKYIPQNGDSGKLSPVYNTTTIPQFHRRKDSSQKLYSRLGIFVAVVALALSAAILVVFFTGSGAKDAEILELQQKIEAQQIRLHRMNKELQFLMTRQKAYEARQEMLQRYRNNLNPLVPDFTRNIENEPLKSKNVEDSVVVDDTELLDKDPVDDETPLETVNDKWLADEEVDVSKLPVASPNKKKGQGKIGSA